MPINETSLPSALTERIDALLQTRPRLLLAIEGPCASGKSTLAAALAARYGGTVFSMDDFFLRPEQRTPGRLAEPGGNVDRERFEAEVLKPLHAGAPVTYRPYDCKRGVLGETRTPPSTALTIVEGAYSLHPDLADYYDFAVFLDITPDEQRRRLAARNPALYERFVREWVPLENRYFQALNPAARCALTFRM